MASGGSGDGDEPEFQIAPMIDVLLVLLIFFMSTITKQVARVDQSITLPVAPDASKRDDARDESIVNVRWNAADKLATYVVDEHPYDRIETVVPLLAARQQASASGKHRVVIRGDRLVPAENINLVMAAAAEANIADVAFAASPR